jgi:hypothetical protein
VQAVKAAPSSEHWKLEPASLEENVKLALVLLVTAGGPESIAVCGALESTVQLWAAGLASVLPAGSVARTWKVCGPELRPVYGLGEVQAVKAAPSSEHWKLEPVSLDENVKFAPVLFDSAGGPESIVVCGSEVSTVQLYEAGLASLFPAGSVARTWKLCGPELRPL